MRQKAEFLNRRTDGYVTRLCRSTQLNVLEEGKRDVQVLRLLTLREASVPKNTSKLAKNLFGTVERILECRAIYSTALNRAFVPEYRALVPEYRQLPYR